MDKPAMTAPNQTNDLDELLNTLQQNLMHCRDYNGELLSTKLIDSPDIRQTFNLAKKKLDAYITSQVNQRVRSALNKTFDRGVETGGDIVLERQFENDPEAYKRYRKRVVDQCISDIEANIENQDV